MSKDDNTRSIAALPAKTDMRQTKRGSQTPALPRARVYAYELSEPLEIRRKCSHCGYLLGAQNPGWVCDICNHTK